MMRRTRASAVAMLYIQAASANLVRNQRKALLTGGWLLVLLAVASVAVLVGGRMADQIRRVGLLKAVGATPSLVAAVLLAEYLVVALVAAGTGLILGRVTAPLLIDSSAGLVGRADRAAAVRRGRACIEAPDTSKPTISTARSCSSGACTASPRR